MGYLIKLLIKEGIHIVIFSFKINRWGLQKRGLAMSWAGSEERWLG